MACSIVPTAVEHVLKLFQIDTPIAVFIHLPNHLLYLRDSVLVDLRSEDASTFEQRMFRE